MGKRIFLGLALMAATQGQADPQDYNYQPTPWWTVVSHYEHTFDKNHVLYWYYAAAKSKGLPTNFFTDLLYYDASVEVKTGDWPRYKPGYFTGTIEIPFYHKSPYSWGRLEWANFYNELFHAWWDTVFTEKGEYRRQRARLFTSSHKTYYKKASYFRPWLAMEEGLSETVSTLIISMYPHTRGGDDMFLTHDYFEYDRGKTVNAVGHSGNMWFSAAAEDVYPSTGEYALLLHCMTGKYPPSW